MDENDNCSVRNNQLMKRWLKLRKVLTIRLNTRPICDSDQLMIFTWQTIIKVLYWWKLPGFDYINGTIHSRITQGVTNPKSLLPWQSWMSFKWILFYGFFFILVFTVAIVKQNDIYKYYHETNSVTM